MHVSPLWQPYGGDAAAHGTLPATAGDVNVTDLIAGGADIQRDGVTFGLRGWGATAACRPAD